MDVFSLGETLRQSRETQALTLEQAESTLKIRRFILEAFEQGNFKIADFSEVQIRGFLRNYARFLNLDEDNVLQNYELASDESKRRRGQPKTPPRSQPDQIPAPPNRPSDNARLSSTQSRRPDDGRKSRRGRGGGRGFLRSIFIILLGIASLGVIVFAGVQMMDGLDLATLFSGNDDNLGPAGILDSDPVGRGIAGVSTSTSTPEIIFLPTGTATLIPRATQVYAGEPLVVTLEFRQRAWAHVIADGEDVFRGVVRPNELVVEQRANNSIVIITTNADALVVTYNGQPQPAYGARGQAVTVTYRPGNEVIVVGGSQVVSPLQVLEGIDIAPVTDDDPEEGFSSPPELPLLPPADEDEVAGLADVPTETFTPEPTSFNPNLPTPLPLLGQPTSPPLPTDVPTATNDAGTQGGLAPTNPPVPTVEVVPPTATPTPNAPLPPRQTPINPTPTKTGA